MRARRNDADYYYHDGQAREVKVECAVLRKTGGGVRAACLI
jgi:hypothetical protein